MMRGLGLLLLTVAACVDGGLIVEVDPVDPTIDHVRLFVGVGDPTMPASFAPQGVAPLDDATYWKRDPNNSPDELLVSDGKPVRFLFVEGTSGEGTLDVIAALIAVGYREGVPIATAYLHDLPIHGDRVDLYKIALTSPVTSFDEPSPNELAVWSEPAIVDRYAAQCAGVNTDGGPAFIVSGGDQDCDGLELDRPDDFECNPNEYMSSRTAGRDELTCVLAPTPGECRLGGPACFDGRAQVDTACDPSQYCAPTSLCDACSTLDCLFDLKFSARAASIQCTVSAAQSNLCADTLVLPRFPSGTAECKGVAIRDGANAFGDHLDIDSAKLDLRFDAACNIGFDPSGDLPFLATGVREIESLLVVDLDNGAGLAVPVLFRVDPFAPCDGAPVMCHANFDGGQWASCGPLPPPPIPCGEPGVIRDDFADPQVNPQWIVSAELASASESTGALVFSIQPNGGIGYRSKHTVDLTGAAVEVEVNSSNAEAFLQLSANPLDSPPNDSFTLSIKGSQLSATTMSSGTSSGAIVTYNANTMRHWRIAETQGTVRYETSPDGTTWTLLTSTTTPPFATTVRINLGGRSATSATGLVAFDNLNTNVPTSIWCAATSFMDSFVGTTISNDWLGRIPGIGSTSTCQLSVSAGAIVRHYAAGQNCYFGTSPAFDLRGSSVTAHIVMSATTAVTCTGYLEVVTDTGNRIAVTKNDQLCGTINGTPGCSPNQLSDTYWRIREHSGTVHVETSADGVTWNMQASALSDGLGLEAVEVRLGAITDPTTPAMTPITIKFDKYN